MNRYDFSRITRKRSGDKADDCAFFEPGLKAATADCDTDGHYMCDYCKHNKHQNKTYYKLAESTGMYT